MQKLRSMDTEKQILWSHTDLSYASRSHLNMLRDNFEAWELFAKQERTENNFQSTIPNKSQLAEQKNSPEVPEELENPEIREPSLCGKIVNLTLEDPRSALTNFYKIPRPCASPIGLAIPEKALYQYPSRTRTDRKSTRLNSSHTS